MKKKNGGSAAPDRRSGAAGKDPSVKARRGKKAAACVVLVTAAVAAAGVTYYYQYQKLDGVFLPNTTVNGQDISRLTPQEVTASVEKIDTDKVITLKTLDGSTETIAYKDLDYRHIWARTPEELQQSQDHRLWAVNLFRPEELEIGEGFTYSEEKLREKILGLKCISGDGIRDPKDAAIVKSKKKKKYVLVPSDDGNRLDPEAVLTAVRDAVESGETEIDLAGQGCYKRALVHTKDESIQKAYKTINDIQNAVITMDLYGSSIQIDKKTFFDWLQFNPSDGTVTLSEDALNSYVDGLAQKYDTYKKPRSFTTSAGDTLTLGGGDDDTYGFILEPHDTREAIRNAILSGQSQEIESVWERTGRRITPDGDDIGSTYIEISIDQQHMWYYQDGELMVSTDVVTGMMTPERRSPTGILYVIGKLTDYTMYGSYGSTFVNYAIMLNEDGVYIHDSSWRSSYGGSIYYNNGSHGCINTPFDQVVELYDLIEDGTPVVIYDRNEM
ncbi:MAG: peptidoglycan binding domain-containing protein [Lachnospiraceae bacterium]|nr:peptidoglycan binding domain-containing protein [Lachnospiraceae bacterium]